MHSDAAHTAHAAGDPTVTARRRRCRVLAGHERPWDERDGGLGRAELASRDSEIELLMNATLSQLSSCRACANLKGPSVQLIGLGIRFRLNFRSDAAEL